MNKGKFFSRQYVVPKTRVFPCIVHCKMENQKEKKEEVIEPMLSSSDDDDDIVAFDDQGTPYPVPHLQTDSNDSDVSQESSDNGSTSQSLGLRRSSRARHTPSRYGEPVSYNSSSSLPGEDNVIQPWWPGYPRGTWNGN